MGFEYKIITILSEEDKKYIVNFIEQKQYTKINTNDGWPDMIIEVEKDGIYICKNRTSDLWKGLEELKKLLEDKGIKYSIEEI